MALYDNSYIIEFEDKTLVLFDNTRITIPVNYTLHTIVEEETLFDISRKYYKVTYRWYPLALVNDITDPVVLIPGDTLKIPTV